jgi:hypothetical protein
VADLTSAVVAPAVVAAVVSVAASGVAAVARRREERRGWLRDVRHEKYAAMIDAGRRLAQVMRWMGPYEEHPQPLAQAYDEWIAASVAAHLLAGADLQEAIQTARFAATRYHETRKPYARFHDWVNDVESAARAELGLPPYAGWSRLLAGAQPVIDKVDAEKPVPPGGSPPHWTRPRGPST